LNLQQEVEAVMNQALEAFNAGRYQQALNLIDEAEKKLSTPIGQMVFLRGACYFNMNDYPNAIQALEQFISKYPQDSSIPQANLALGRSYISKGEVDKGIETLKALVNNAPTFKAEAGLYVAEALLRDCKPP
jgi:TolA-binding protein